VSPLVTRPAYSIVGEAKLPVGEPAGRGLSLDPSIPGTSTYAKPSGEPPRDQTKDDESMYRVDDANDISKSQSRPDAIDMPNLKPSIGVPGPEDGNGKTRYPYRGHIVNDHSASMVMRVAHSYLAELASEALIDFGLPTKVATKVQEVEEGLGSHVVRRSKSCVVTQKRVDIPNLRWIFSVDCGNGTKAVKMKAARKGNVTALTKMDVTFTCSCNAWRWLGSEYHAKKDTYLDGKPRGTTTVPRIRDPNGVNRVCKHVASVIGKVRKWSIPLK
jgi:hypothetical protein